MTKAESVREYQRRYRAKNRDKVNAASAARTRKYRLRNYEKYLAQAREYSRKKAGLPTPTRDLPARCEACGEKPGHALCIDHDHATGKFRGWLCKSCNLALGYAKDNPVILKALAEYLLDA